MKHWRIVVIVTNSIAPYAKQVESTFYTIIIDLKRKKNKPKL